jgi:hypothetical protein
MNIRYSGNYSHETGLSKLTDKLFLSNFFSNRYYGNRSTNLVFTIVCLDEVVKQTCRYSKVQNRVNWDIVLNYLDFVCNSEIERKQKLAYEIISSFDILLKYPQLNFDVDSIKKDLFLYFTELKWITK